MEILQSLIWLVISFGISTMIITMCYVILLKSLVFLKILTYEKRPFRGKDGAIIMLFSVILFLFMVVKNRQDIFPYLS
ncbi:hypothetical protein PM10SUCC1_26800 [Propionigenium maris DSM 9537]|uniref:Uncharacterized protein n=1 Tax=Propionigenium maris DSM 9537 TaxID=1123000 RepID=A0A9W6LNB5_9FUSO|nr:hypothetical protein PM10SUCC1_26800 [Propionigenium maris DSM 9537]